MNRSPIAHLLSFVFLFFAFDCALAQTQPLQSNISKSSTRVESDLSVKWGRLKNGVRYALKPNATPANKVAIVLSIRAGSLDEMETQQGANHLLAHMAFAGDAHYAPADLEKALRRFMHHFNAHVIVTPGFDETEYRLNLPDTQSDTIAAALSLMADWAGGLRLSSEDVERGRMQALAEMQRSDTVDLRQDRTTERFRYAGTLAGQRLPLASIETIKKVDVDALRSYYDTWYRPENMLVVVVGAIDTDTAARQIEHALGGLSDRAPAKERADLGGLKATDRPFVQVQSDDGATHTTVFQERMMVEPEPFEDTPNIEQQELLRQIAERIFRRRMEANVAGNISQPIANAEMYSDRWMGFATMGLRVSVLNKAHALDAMGEAQKQYRRMMEFGPTDAEVDFERTLLQERLDAAAALDSKQDSAALAREIAACETSGRVFQSPVQRRELLQSVLGAATRVQIVEALQSFADRPGRISIAIYGREDLGKDAEQSVRTVYERAMSSPIVPPPQGQVNRWQYGDLSDANGTVWMTEREDEAAAGLHVLWSHPNGLRMQVRPNKTVPGEVLLALRFDINDSEVKTHRPAGVEELIERGLAPGGLGLHTAQEVRSLFAASSVKFTGVHLSDDAVTYTAQCNGRDLIRALQLLRAYSADPGWRQDAEGPVKQAWLDELAAQEKDGNAVVERRVKILLAEPYPWRKPATVDDVKSLHFSDAREWLTRALDNATLTVSVVGDVDDDAAGTVAQWFGRYKVNARFMQASVADARASALGPVPVKAEAQRIQVAPKDGFAAVHVVWATDDAFDAHRTSSLRVLARCLGLLMQQRFGDRAKAWSTVSNSVRGEGEMHLLLQVPAGQADEALASIRTQTSHEIDAALVKRAQTDVLTSLSSQRLSNEWWISTVMPYAGWQPFRIGWAAREEEEVQSVTSDEVNQLVRTYLLESRMISVAGSAAQ